MARSRRRSRDAGMPSHDARRYDAGLRIARRGPRADLGSSPRTRVTEVQRARILSAAVRVVGELGYEGMSVARVTGRAGVSRRTFYELFEDREDCFLALFDEVAAHAGMIVRAAAAGRESWREQVRAGLSALLMFVDDEPVLGSVLVVDALGAGPRVLERRTRELEVLKRVVEKGPS